MLILTANHLKCLPGACRPDRASCGNVAAARQVCRPGVWKTIDRDDVFITNIVACRPPGNRAPRVTEVRAHAPWIEQQIRLVDPTVVVALGRVALTYFIPKGRVTELRGSPQEVQYGDGELMLFPTLHPAAALRDPDLRPALESDFRKAAKLLKQLAAHVPGSAGSKRPRRRSAE